MQLYMPHPLTPTDNEFVAFVSSENLVDNVVTVMVGGNLTLFLNISANPDVPTLNRNSSGIVSSALTISSVALLFTQVSRTDEGNYSISVSNTAGTSSFSFELMVVERKCSSKLLHTCKSC